jgi:hypothetical protein
MARISSKRNFADLPNPLTASTAMADALRKADRSPQGMQRAVGATFKSRVKTGFMPKLERGHGASMNRTFIPGGDHALNFDGPDADMLAISDKLGIGADLRITKVNVTKGRTEVDRRSFHDDETRETITKVFQEEIDLPGYTF